jgi:hypothetical protein
MEKALCDPRGLGKVNLQKHSKLNGFTVFFLASLIVICSGAFAGEPEFAVVLLVVDHLWDRLEHLFAVAANQRVRSV